MRVRNRNTPSEPTPEVLRARRAMSLPQLDSEVPSVSPTAERALVDGLDKPDPVADSHSATVADSEIRRLNVLVALLGIVATLPLMALIALAVKLTSAGPIIYRQERVGHDRRDGHDRRQARRGADGADRRDPDRSRRTNDAGGRIFTIYKFRTMEAYEKESETEQVWASPDDCRITPVGSFLRESRLDELPQLFNVLLGDMNVVGPRPEQPQIFKELESQVERYSQRQIVRPGITGWAQINNAYDQSLDDVRRKVELDLEYIRRRSPAEDLKIMTRTLPVMIGRRGGPARTESLSAQS